VHREETLLVELDAARAQRAHTRRGGSSRVAFSGDRDGLPPASEAERSHGHRFGAAPRRVVRTRPHGRVGLPGDRPRSWRCHRILPTA
jgi:hypothetical protein